MKINELGLKLIKEFENCKLTVYLDIVGVPTVGYGTTGDDVVLGDTWTLEEVETRLNQDLERFEGGVEDLVTVGINENQFSALVCFAYNVGLAALKRSHLLEYVNEGKFSEASEQFERWNKASGKEVPGLTRRRLAEKSLFLT